uniref:Pseudouridylate synthase 7 homolog n=1 Tax=Cacopsylla melanoneura TaxID=428564 RepID=A0A8D9ASW1_9HEMI
MAGSWYYDYLDMDSFRSIVKLFSLTGKQQFRMRWQDPWYYDYLDMDSFRSSVKLFSLTGSYRKIVLKAPDVAWSIIRHDLPDDDILLSDACKLANRTLSEFKTKSLKAVAIEMTLPPGVYATMALREVMKCSAYAAHQRTPVSSVPIPVVQTEEGAYIDY